MQCKTCNEPMDKSHRKWGWRCAKCIADYKREWAKTRRSKGMPAGGKASPEWWEAYRKRYYADPKVRKRRAALMKKYSNDPAHRMKHEARWQVARAIKTGKLKRGPCAKCGKTKTQAHHPDYYKPLEVIWLCVTCHRTEHTKADGR